jgi:hypothetical protein
MNTKPRAPIRPDMNVSDLLVCLSEGNPGGLTVLRKLIDEGEIYTILALDNMNIRGPQLWVLFKDLAKGDLQMVKHFVETRSPEWVKHINEECPEWKVNPAPFYDFKEELKGL